MDEEIDDIDEDDDDDYDGGSTPKIRSRSTSPQPCDIASLSVTATTITQVVSSALHGCTLSTFRSLPSCLTNSIMPPSSHPHTSISGKRTGPDRRTVLASSLDKEQSERERLVDEDCSLAMLSPDQGCLFTGLLSPGWESPLREPSPSQLRYPSPRRDLSPRGRSSPRWDTSQLRPSSPNLTPIQHLSPACMERPLSPGGVDLVGRREPSARGRQRVVLRAVSPRRGGSQHRGSGDKTMQQAKAELVHKGGSIEMDLVCNVVVYTILYTHV